MSLTGMQIFKYLPAAKKAKDTNCKACGCATCMAFALKLAKKQADIEKCPHVPDELKEKFVESSKIQQHVIKLSETLFTGGETVMYRHDKTFVNRTVIAVELDADDSYFEKKLKRIADYQIERIGETFRVDAIYLTCGSARTSAGEESSDAQSGTVQASSDGQSNDGQQSGTAQSDTVQASSVCQSIGNQQSGTAQSDTVQACFDEKTPRLSQAFFKAAKLIENAGLALIHENGGLSGTDDEYSIVRGNTIEELEQASKKALESGMKHILLEPVFSAKSGGAYNGENACTNNGENGCAYSGDSCQKPFSSLVEELIQIRKSAIIDRYEPFTYPVIVRMPENPDFTEVCAQASVLICKYAGVIVLKEFDEALVSTLFTLRQNIFTNPQKPLQVEAKVYEFNEPDRHAPILLTTNFALTYFAVASELESLPFGSYLVVTPSDGMSVLTAWSADKFTAALAARSVKEYGLLDKVDTRKIIIPGLLSHMREELQEAMPEWEIVTGTVEACKIPEFLSRQ